jgi:hypothetical protein
MRELTKEEMMLVAGGSGYYDDDEAYELDPTIVYGDYDPGYGYEPPIYEEDIALANGGGGGTGEEEGEFVSQLTADELTQLLRSMSEIMEAGQAFTYLDIANILAGVENATVIWAINDINQYLQSSGDTHVYATPGSLIGWGSKEIDWYDYSNSPDDTAEQIFANFINTERELSN